MNGSYRDELDAALTQADALRRDNDALKRENSQLREGMPPTVTARPPRRRSAVLLVMVAGAALGMGLSGFVVATLSRPKAAVTLPVAPGTADIDRAFHDVQPAVDACRTGLQHAVTMSVTFDSSGAVSQVEPVSPADRSETGQCLARALRGARVQPFSGPEFPLQRVFIL